MFDIPQFTQNEVCLLCEGCCRFIEEKSIWRPKAEKGSRLQTNSVNNYLNLKKDKDIFLCSYFEKKDNKCREYLTRPFECRLYPFLIYKQEDGIFLGVHCACPYVQTKQNSRDFESYVSSLEKYFAKKEVINFIKENKHLASDYSGYEDEIDSLFNLEF